MHFESFFFFFGQKGHSVKASEFSKGVLDLGKGIVYQLPHTTLKGMPLHTSPTPSPMLLNQHCMGTSCAPLHIFLATPPST